jgi:uncharacterized protein (TIGR00251 family)
MAVRTRIVLKIHAGAKRTAFAGKLGDAWKIHVAAPAVDGKANAALLKFLARLTGRPSGEVRLVSGFTSTLKIVEIDGIDADAVNRAILESHGSQENSGIA